MTKQHKNLENSELHVPKDFDGADKLTALTKDINGALVWKDQTDIGGEGPPGPPGPGSADTVTMDEVASGGSINNVQTIHTRMNSAGLFNGNGDVTDNGDGTIAITQVKGLIRAVDDVESNLLTFDVAALASLALADNEINFVYVEFNAGTPRLISTIIARLDFNTNVLLSQIFREGTTLHIFNPDRHVVGDGINSVLLRLKDTDPFQRAAGATIAETGVLNFSVTSGKFWQGLTDFITNSIDTSGVGRFVYVHRDGVGGFIETPAQATIDNQNFDDGTGTLAALGNNLFGVHWVYVESDSGYVVLYGQGDFTLTQAQDNSSPALVPKRLQVHGRLIGKIIIQKSAVVFISIESAFQQEFVGAMIADHNNLSSLQGGNATERFHLALNEFLPVSSIAISVLTGTSIDMSGDKFKTKTITENTVFSLINPTLGSVIHIRLDGDFTVTLPATVGNKSIGNEYDGTKINNLFILCINAVAPLYIAALITED